MGGIKFGSVTPQNPITAYNSAPSNGLTPANKFDVAWPPLPPAAAPDCWAALRRVAISTFVSIAFSRIVDAIFSMRCSNWPAASCWLPWAWILEPKNQLHLFSRNSINASVLDATGCIFNASALDPSVALYAAPKHQSLINSMCSIWMRLDVSPAKRIASTYSS